MLKYRKQQLALEQDFTYSIFALLLKSYILSTFLEYKLTNNFFTLQQRILRNYSLYAISIAYNAKKVVCIIARDKRLLLQRLALEVETGCVLLLDIPTAILAALLKQKKALLSQIKEITNAQCLSLQRYNNCLLTYKEVVLDIKDKKKNSKKKNSVIDQPQSVM